MGGNRSLGRRIGIGRRILDCGDLVAEMRWARKYLASAAAVFFWMCEALIAIKLLVLLSRWSS